MENESRGKFVVAGKELRRDARQVGGLKYFTQITRADRHPALKDLLGVSERERRILDGVGLVHGFRKFRQGNLMQGVGVLDGELLVLLLQRSQAAPQALICHTVPLHRTQLSVNNR